MNTPYNNKCMVGQFLVYTVDTRDLDNPLAVGAHVTFSGTTYVIEDIITRQNDFGGTYPIVGVAVKPLTAEEL